MTNHDLKNRILEEIQHRNIAMRPKFYFTLRLLALVLVACATLIISVLILNFILFSIRLNSHDMLLQFGPRGLGAFLRFFPWPLLVVDIALIAALQSLVRQFRFGYKIPVLYMLGALVVVTVLVGSMLDRGTRFNDNALSRADRHELFGPIGEIYEHLRHAPPPGICKCTVLGIAGNTLTLRDGTSTIVVMLPQDNPHATTTGLSVGDIVFIAGDLDDGVVHAFGVHKISPQDMHGLPPQLK